MSIITLPLPIQLINGQIADAGQVMTDLNAISSNVNANAAKNGVNSDITELTALTSIVSGLSLTGASLFNCSFTLGAIYGSSIDGTTVGVTQPPGTNTTQLATTEYVINQQFASLVSSGLRNRIINGDHRIDQRNSGAAVTPTVTATFLTDRFQQLLTQPSKLTYQQVADAPPGFKFSLKCTVANQYNPISTDVFIVRQRIEGQNIIDFQLGMATAQTITITVWVKGSVPGTYNCAIKNLSATRSYIGNITVSTVWAKQTITLTLETTGTWLTDNGTGISFSIDLGSGSNFNTTSGSWQSSNSFRTSSSVTFVNQINGSTLNFTGLQIEMGTVSTVFEQRPIGLELSLCQRYYSEIVGGAGQCISTTRAYIKAVLPVTMRVSPSINVLTAGSISDATGISLPATSNTILNPDTVSPLLLVGVGSGLVSGNGTILLGSRLGFSAEL